MTEIKVIVTGPEEAYDYEAEFWCANEPMGSPCSTRDGYTCASTRERTARRGWRTSPALRTRWPRRTRASLRTDATNERTHHADRRSGRQRAGPDAFAFEDAAARVLDAANVRRRVVADPDARYLRAVVTHGVVLPGPDAHIATMRLADWLTRHYENAATAPSPPTAVTV